MRTLIPTLFLALPAVLLPALPAASAPSQEEENAADSLASLVKTLKSERDNAEVDLVKKLANLKTREAMEALIELYEEMQSIYMRRAVCQGLALYDDVSGAEQPALDKLMNVAAEAPERELREAAVELLGSCDNYGASFLRILVESSADDDIRERALTYHVNRAREEDKSWYREIYDPTAAEKAKKAAKKARDEQDKVPHRLQPLRVLAFGALVVDMEVDEVVRAASDKNRKIRARALQELDSRGDKQAMTVAEDLYDKTTEPVPTRLVAARILSRNLGAKTADRFIKDATKKETPREFVYGLADLLVEMDDEKTNGKLLKKAGKGKGVEKLFYLRATAHLEDPKLDKALVKLLKDKDPEVQRVACELLGKRRHKEAVEDLSKLIDKGKDPLVITAAIEATTQLRTNDREWEAQLQAYASHEESDVRNAAVSALGRMRNPAHLPTVVEALNHEAWSTRLAAARAIEAMRLEAGVGPLCERVGQEVGRMAVEMTDILFRLTGKSFRSNSRQWVDWWKNEGDSFKIVSAGDLRKLEQEEEARRLKQISRTEFFGIRIESHRVIFIIDVSGSMNEPTRGKYVGERGAPRIEVAKEELLKALDGMEIDSLYNIVTFSSDVGQWQDRIVEKNDTSLEEARSYVGRLGAGGATNLYGALKFSFGDPDVDTIFVMSDGEPTAGDVTDGGGIRAAVEAWNKNRGVVIHSVAVGGSLQILEWLAEDTGGTYRQYP